MSAMLDRFRSTIIANPNLSVDDPRLLIDRAGDLAMYYSPFEFIQPKAKVVLVGITPGASQAATALRVLRRELSQGAGEVEALRNAKSTASFGGPLRTNLVAMLNSIGLNRTLGVDSCCDAFKDGSDLFHFTSALRFPTFHKGKNYSGRPSIASSRFLSSISDTLLREEATSLPNAIWIPLGKEPAAAVERLVSMRILEASKALDGLPHPSGANSERVSYFIGKKARSQLSSKTDPILLDGVRVKLARKLQPNSAPQASDRLALIDFTMVPINNEPATPDEPVRHAGGRESDRAERALALAFKRVKNPTVKVAGFETKKGRQLAIQRDSASIRLWTEEVEFPEGLGKFERYSASTPRHSNLRANAPRCADGRHARLWDIDGLDKLKKLIIWYGKA